MQAPQPPRKYLTDEAAQVLRYKPQSMRRELCVKGHFHGLIPTKMLGGRLLWDADAVDALARGERTADAV